MIRLFLGISLLIAAALKMFGLIEITEPYVFGFSLSVLFMSLVSYLDDPLKEIKNKKSFSIILKFVFLFLSIMSFVLVPLIYNTPVIQTITTSIDNDTFLLFGIAFSFLTLFSGDRNLGHIKKLFEIEKQKAVNEKVNEIISKVDSIKNKRKP
ncbi:hypothetical protein CXK86_20185 [Paenibacillus sp. BGI2013]|uniref:hypothetical protein n=1 Tax=unclassified Paenibacillus TaxID=185978 RepID=UPI000887699D|nr:MULTISPECIES: hypothetical protein [unclassified Paenibacillus]PKQ89372.1 hypothetical protein CXK86_20185 [Paenibacillus sp. BGI2013]SDD48050.1 hypothetical protein SAMN05428987_4909 [Paenibacillus sp. CF095]